MQLLQRSTVYEVIDGERDYQDGKFPQNPPLTPSEALRVIRELLAQNETDWYNSSDSIVEGHRINARDLHALRKIAATAIRAMEHWGAPARSQANR